MFDITTPYQVFIHGCLNFYKVHKERVPLIFLLLSSSIFLYLQRQLYLKQMWKPLYYFFSRSLSLNFKLSIILVCSDVLGKQFHSLISPLGLPPCQPIYNNFSSSEVESRALSSAIISRPELLLDFFSAKPPLVWFSFVSKSFLRRKKIRGDLSLSTPSHPQQPTVCSRYITINPTN